MINAETLASQLCDTFCSSVTVNPVPSGYAVSTLFTDQSGDRIGFYVVESEEGFRIEDDGEYLAQLMGSGVPLDNGQRARFLDEILDRSGVYWDRDTLEIKSQSFQKSEISKRMIDFLSALIRVRDIELVTRDFVRSTFREDVTQALREKFADEISFSEDEAVNDNLSEFPADLIMRPTTESKKTGALYFVNSNERLTEALLLQMETERLNISNVKVIAFLKDSEMKAISRKKFQRAQNRSVSMPIFYGDENAALTRVARELEI